MLLSSQNPLRAASLLNFEGLPDSTVLNSQYAGAVFSHAIILTSGITLNEFEFPPHSGTNVASDNGGPITISFSPPVQSISGYFTYAVPLTMRAFNSANAQVASATSRFSNNEALSGISGSSPNEFLQVSSAGGIATVTITADPAGNSFTLDDLNYGTSTSVPTLSFPALLLLGLLIVSVGAFAASGNHTATRQIVAALFFTLTLSLLVLRLPAGPREPASKQSTSDGSATIQTFSAKPASLRAHESTRIMITARISHLVAIPGSINLIRLNPDGSAAIIGHLRDVGNDLYGAQPLFNEVSAGPVQLHVSVAIHRKVKRAVSEPFTVTVGSMR